MFVSFLLLKMVLSTKKTEMYLFFLILLILYLAAAVTSFLDVEHVSNFSQWSKFVQQCDYRLARQKKKNHSES